ncbi:MAG: site-specific integrase [Clostridia bacterium]|jgi:integrase|nr:site-specific integrase [Clostridia bacterium]
MGLRISEVLALTTHDIDLESRRLRVKRTLTKDELGNTIMGKSTKTYAGKRELPIPDYLLNNIIEQMRIAENQDNNEEKLLFKPEYKKYADRENANNELKRLLKRIFGIEDITTHSLRHTYGTRCIESGMAPVVVQRLMGHTDIAVTLNTYTSVFDEFKQKEIDKVNKYYLKENMITATRLLEDIKPNKENEELEL